jgi:endoglucanase
VTFWNGRLKLALRTCFVALIATGFAISAVPSAAHAAVLSVTTSPNNDGYWTATTEGWVAANGATQHLGDMRNETLNRPVVGMAPTPSGKGYWLVASDGGVFSFGDASFRGSTGGTRLNKPVVGMAPTPSGKGYWLVASDGGVFSFGDASFRGSGVGKASSFTGLTTDGRGGYALLRGDGGLVERFAPVLENPSVPPVPPTTVPPTTTPTNPGTTPPSTTTTTTTAPPPSSSGNPFSGKSLWVDPSNPAINQANQWRSSRPGDAELMERMGKTAAAMWIGEWSGNVRDTVANVTNTAASRNEVPVFIAYNIPGRDCGQYSSGGLSQASEYKAWIRNFADGIGDKGAVVVLEPDALSQLDCLDTAGKVSRLDLLKDAVNVIESKPKASVYIDAGHPGWHSADEMANRLNQAGVQNARGFSLNVSNFVDTSSNVSYGNALASRLGNARYIVDTSRNGNGAGDTWCNPTGRALGQQPSTNTGQSRADAFLWLKRPGESDGTCNGGPNAGEWWADYALGLATRAWR